MDNYNKRIIFVINNSCILMFNNPNVVAFARGFKNINGYYVDKPCLTVFVKKKLYLDKLSSSNVIPNNFYGIQTDVVEMGEISFFRPAQGGSSISLDKSNYRGTLGYAVTDRGANKNLYILTCRHVCEEEEIPNMKTVVEPPYLNGGSKIGTIEKMSIAKTYVKGDRSTYNEIDAAIVYVGPNNFETQNKILKPEMIGSFILTGTKEARLKEEIMKVGTTTGNTQGKIIGMDGIIVSNDLLYKNQILTTYMGSHGDSGSIGFTVKGNKAIGLLSAGSKEFTVYNPINKVLDYFNVEIAKIIF